MVGRQAQAVALAGPRLEAGVVVAIGGEQIEPVARHPAGLALEAIGLGFTGIGGDELGADLLGRLEVFIAVEIDRAVQADAAIHQGRLEAGLVAVDGLGRDLGEVRRAEGRGRHGHGQHRRTTAAGVGGVEASVVRDGIAAGQTVGQAVVLQIAGGDVAVAGRGLEGQAEQREGGRDRSVGGARRGQLDHQAVGEGAEPGGLGQGGRGADRDQGVDLALDLLEGQQAAGDGTTVQDRGAERRGLLIRGVANAGGELEPVGRLPGQVAEDVERLQLGVGGRRLDVAGLQVVGDTGAGRRRDAEAGQQRLQEGLRRIDRAGQGGRQDGQRRAVQDAGQLGQGQTFVDLDRRGRLVLFAEIAGADEARQGAAIVPVHAELLAPLLAVGDADAGQDRQGDAVRVEGLGRLEGAIGADRVQGQAVRQVIADQTGHAPDFAVDAQFAAARDVRPRRQGGGGARIAVRAQDRARVRILRVVIDRAEADARGRVLLVVGDHIDAQGVGRLEGGQGAEGLGIDAVVVATVQQVLDIAVAGLHAGGEAEGGRVADRRVQHQLDHAVVVGADGGAALGGEAVEIGLGLDHIDRADQGAAAVQGRLRTLGDLDPVDIEQFDEGARRARDGDAVLVDRHARLIGGAGRVRGQAADHEARVVRRLVLHQQAGHEGRQFLEVLNAEPVQELAAVGGQGERDLDRVLGAQLGGDDHLFQLGRLVGRHLGVGGGGQRARGGAAHKDGSGMSRIEHEQPRLLSRSLARLGGARATGRRWSDDAWDGFGRLVAERSQRPSPARAVFVSFAATIRWAMAKCPASSSSSQASGSGRFTHLARAR